MEIYTKKRKGKLISRHIGTKILREYIELDIPFEGCTKDSKNIEGNYIIECEIKSYNNYEPNFYNTNINKQQMLLETVKNNISDGIKEICLNYTEKEWEENKAMVEIKEHTGMVLNDSYDFCNLSVENIFFDTVDRLYVPTDTIKIEEKNIKEMIKKFDKYMKKLDKKSYKDYDFNNYYGELK